MQMNHDFISHRRSTRIAFSIMAGFILICLTLIVTKEDHLLHDRVNRHHGELLEIVKRMEVLHMEILDHGARLEKTNTMIRTLQHIHAQIANATLQKLG